MAEPLAPATTIAAAFNAVDPDKALPPGDPRHVDFTPWRGDDTIAKQVARRIRRAQQEPGRYVKQLVAGHRGSGKTTELLRLKERLASGNEPFVVIYFDSAEQMDMEDADYADVLLTTLGQVVTQAPDYDLHVPDVSLARLKNKLDPVVENVVTETRHTAEVEAGAEAKGALPWVGGLFAKVRAAMRNDVATRQEIRSVVKQSPTLFLEELNDTIDNLHMQARSRGKAGLVVIVDSLDRVQPTRQPEGGTTHTEIFVTHATQLKAPRCHMVFTVPISLTVDQHLGMHYPLDTVVQPMVRVREEDGSENDEAVDAMVEAVRRRLDVEALFEDPSDVRRLVLFSGGHIRDLMHLLTSATDYADERITARNVRQAEGSLARAYNRLVLDADLERLTRIHATRQLPPDPEYALLPYHLLVLKYMNGEEWADVHPAVRETRRFKRAWQRRDTPLLP